jgi:DNA-binding protein H-NS
MGKLDLEAMSMDDLWTLHEELSKLLSVRIAAEKLELEKRLAVLRRRSVDAGR